uniref:B-keto acyl reductase n=1 Tax=Leersia perrieri TaxID=77586 RepID=A0A0D9WPI6_9ORYZ
MWEAVDGVDIGVAMNNAGLGQPGSVFLHEADLEAWVRMITGEPAGWCWGYMMERGRGAVVNVGSAASEAIPSLPLYSVYVATKRYVHTNTKHTHACDRKIDQFISSRNVGQFFWGLHVEYASKGIDVHCLVVAPMAWWFRSLAFLGAACVASVTLRLLAYLALSLRRPNDMRLSYGAWAVVTGPTSGIGRSIALELARRGMNLVLVGRDPANLREISDTIRSRHGVQTKTVVFDLSLVSTAHGEEPLRRLREAVEGLDVGVLVNNAGVAQPYAMRLHEADVEAWVRMMRVNLWAVTEVTAAVLPGMVERGRGAVVNIGSASSEATPSFPFYTVYAATKRYVAQFSRSLHVEYASKRIHVQCQAPLFVATRMVAKFMEASWLSPFVVSADDYACAAVGWIGHGGALCGRTYRTSSRGALPPSCRTLPSTGSSYGRTPGAEDSV